MLLKIQPLKYKYKICSFHSVSNICIQDVPLLLVGTKIDLRKDKSTAKSAQPSDQRAGENMASDVKAAKYLECSALTQVGYILLPPSLRYIVNKFY